MKLKPDINIPKFLLSVSECSGTVRFVTPEGDDLNLKSALSQFIFAAVIGAKLQDFNGDVIVENDEDLHLLKRFCS